MEVISKLIPKGHLNRFEYPIELPYLSYIVHTTDNYDEGTGALWHADFFARPWDVGQWYDKIKKTIVKGNIEKNSLGADKEHPDCGIQFRVAATHEIVDDKYSVQMIPPGEFVPGAGDRPFSYDNGYKGQLPLAKWAFNNRQNYLSYQLEMAVNKGNNWDKTVKNAMGCVIDFCSCHGYLIDKQGSLYPDFVTSKPRPGHIYLLRHYDVTGKICPRPFVRDPVSWINFVTYCVAAVNGGQP